MLRYMELEKKKKRRIEVWCVKKIIRTYDNKNVNIFSVGYIIYIISKIIIHKIFCDIIILKYTYSYFTTLLGNKYILTLSPFFLVSFVSYTYNIYYFFLNILYMYDIIRLYYDSYTSNF